MKEEALLSGPLEPTNEAYAIAKIAGIKLCQAYRKQYGCDFISAMPTNLYGPNDNFDLTSSHVLPAMIRKFHDAREEGRTEVTIWGTGTPRREFLHVDDLADACVFLMKTLQRRDAHQRRHRRGSVDRASWRKWSGASSTQPRRSSTTARSRTARRESCSTCRGCTRSAGVIACRSAKASKHTYNWFLANHATARGHFGQIA